MLLKTNFTLLGHALNGNNVDQMQGAFNEIQEYLFNRSNEPHTAQPCVV